MSDEKKFEVDDLEDDIHEDVENEVPEHVEFTPEELEKDAHTHDVEEKVKSTEIEKAIAEVLKALKVYKLKLFATAMTATTIEFEEFSIDDKVAHMGALYHDFKRFKDKVDWEKVAKKLPGWAVSNIETPYDFVRGFIFSKDKIKIYIAAWFDHPSYLDKIICPFQNGRHVLIMKSALIENAKEMEIKNQVILLPQPMAEYVKETYKTPNNYKVHEFNVKMKEK